MSRLIVPGSGPFNDAITAGRYIVPGSGPQIAKGTVGGSASVAVAATSGSPTSSISFGGYVAPGASVHVAATTANAQGSAVFAVLSAGSFTTTKKARNNAGTLEANTAITWSWNYGTVGAETGRVIGSGTTDSNGYFTAPGLAAGVGYLIMRTAAGAVYYEEGTVT